MFFVGGLTFATPQDGEPEYDDCSTPKEVGLMKRINNSKIGWNDAKYCSLMQYTGLKDKNGKEIYEGDVLDNGMYPHVMIFWDKEYAGFRVTTYSCIKKLSEYVNNWEVIGNIYENHELLKDTEE